MPPFPGAPTPKTALGYHRILSPSAGVRVSPLCLGAMNFGTAWEKMMGKCDKKTTYEILDFFFESGGNFIDTANNYQGEESEEWLGDWMEERKNRDQIVLATKFTTFFPSGKGGEKINSNFQGNHSKSLRVSTEASLRKLKTSYIDLLYVHWWDFSTSIPELMQSLHHLVAAGKILYLGISDTPAWVVSMANQYARDHALTPFSVYQGKWSAADRDFERDIIPMAQQQGMALAPWNALGGGLFKTEEELAAQDEGRKMFPPREKDKKVAAALDKLAKPRGVHRTAIALAYVMHKSPYVFPIVGGRNINHLKGNIEALSIELSPQEIEQIEEAEPFDVGFPMNFLFEFGDAAKYHNRMGTGDIGLVKTCAHIDTVPKPEPIKPRKL
ncbi:Norsolorinic acid reductase [Lasiodiplodia theobromae]|uniref:Norsolorinic acid reductase n=1 Tax=Lasiodiplodia theobromae TaxID=45133 RepID=UPI0015C30662|nr:Norsolorinic acid reductase [Lasiodiplodia theobromae]KAF4539026.1 Norsolorinic acid reductase [Lasiodiplodia theobromae]